MYFYNESLIISLHSLHKYNKLYLKLIKYSLYPLRDYSNESLEWSQYTMEIIRMKQR